MYRVKIIDTQINAPPAIRDGEHKVGDIIEIRDEQYRLSHKDKWFEVIEHYTMEKKTTICDKCGKKSITWDKKVEA